MRYTRVPAVCTLIGLAVIARAWAQAPLDPPPSLGQHQVTTTYPQMTPAPVAPSGPYQTQSQPWPQGIGPAPVMQAPSSTPAPGGPVPLPLSPAPINPTPMPQMTPPSNMPAPAMPISAAPVTPMAGQGVSVEKRGPEVLNLSQPLAYEIIVRNTCSTPVSEVRVEDELPSGARLISGDPLPEMSPEKLTWSLNTLEPGAERHLQVKLQLGSDGEIRSTATVRYSATCSMKTRVVQPRVVLALHGPEQVATGDSVPFRIMVSNPGSGPATNVVLHCKLPEGLNHPQGRIVEAELGTVGPGETRNVTLTTQAVKSGSFVNEMSATADGGLESSAQSPIQIVGPTLQLLRTGPPKCYLKSEVGFELEVVNSGIAPASYVEVGDTLPAGLEFVSATEGGRYDPANRTIVWRLPALQAGGHQRVGYRVKAVGLGEMPDRAAARPDRGQDVRADATFTVEGIPALSLEVVDLEDPIEVGSDLTYEIRVVNQGSCPCTNIQIFAQAPDGLLPRDGTGPTAFHANGAEVAFEPLQKLAIKADAVYRVKVRGLQPGDYRFRVQMTCDQLRAPVMKEESSRVYKEGP